MKLYEEDMQYYPTPKALLDKICEGMDWTKIQTVLEPSAGKGDIAEYVKETIRCHGYRYNAQIDCIEKDRQLRLLLEGKEFHVIHDDFLTYQGQFHYNLIIMNPPFADGDKHLMKALEIQKYGGSILCILNAETIEHPYSNLRKALLQKLEDLHADISFYEDAFCGTDAERKTKVRIAVVKVTVPEQEFHSEIYERLTKKQYADLDKPGEATDVTVQDLVKSIVKQYDLEIDAGLQLIREYKGMQKYILSSLKEDAYAQPLLVLKVGDHACSENEFIRDVRSKYWNALFRDQRFMKNMTSDQQQSYLQQVNDLANYDFSYSNIKEIQISMAKHMAQGIEDCIIKLFDDCSNKHSWYPECEKTIHYYNGWARNKAWIINEKIILPISIFYKDFDNKTKISTCSYYRTVNLDLLYDIEKVFNYLGGTPQRMADCGSVLMHTEHSGETKNVSFKYFDATFYKKGTCHITFKDTETLKKFNIFGSQKKGWLPPSYGKKQYHEMEQEERDVIDEFQGMVDYEYILANADRFLYNPESSLPQLACSI